MNRLRSRGTHLGFGIVPALVLVLAMLMSPSVGAQFSESDSEEVTRTVSVSGKGVVTVDPDTASLSLGVVAIDESLEDAQQSVSNDLASTTEALTDAGILPEDIKTTSYDVYPVPEYDRDGNYEGIERYQVSTGLEVTVRDIDSVGTILDAVVDAGVNQVWSISFYVEDPSSAASQARQAAVDDARGRADELATASGTVVVGVISISENYAPPPAPVAYSMDQAAEGAMEADIGSVPVSAGQAEIRVEVSIVFEIEPAAG